MIIINNIQYTKVNKKQEILMIKIITDRSDYDIWLWDMIVCTWEIVGFMLIKRKKKEDQINIYN